MRVSGSSNFWVTAIGAIILFIGFNLFVPMAWAWSAENYPTRARATGFALVDGIGHIGGGVGIMLDRGQHLDAWPGGYLPGNWRVPGGGGDHRPVWHLDQRVAPGRGLAIEAN